MIKNLLLFVLVFGLSVLYAQEGDPTLLKKQLDTVKNVVAKVDILNELSLLEINNDPEVAREFATQALTLAKENNYISGQGFALYNLGNVNYYLDEYDEGLAKMDSSKIIFEQENNIKGLGYSYNTTGEIYTIMGNYRDALKALFDALKYFDSSGDKVGMARVNNNIGLIHYYQKNFDEALKYFTQALKTGDETRVGDASLYIGRVYVEMSNFMEGRKYLSKAMEIGMKNDDKYIISDYYYLMGRIDAFYGETDLALSELLKSLDIKKAIEDNQGIALVCVQVGNLFILKKNPLMAKSYFMMAKNIATEIGVKEELKDAYKGLSNTYSYMGKYDSAYIYLDEHNKIYQQLVSEEASKKLAELEATLTAQKRETEIESERKIEAFFRKVMIWSGVSIILVLIGLTYLMYNRYRMKKKANDQLAMYNAEITLQKEIIEVKNTDIMASIRYAKRIQETILPANEIIASNIKDFFIFYKPKDIVSGDFYWAYEIQPKKLLIAAVDCTGHGVPGAFVSIVGFNGLNQAVKEFQLVHPADILDKLNLLVDETFLSHSSSNIKDGMDINLCMVDYLEDGSANVEFAAANNPLWLFRKDAEPAFTEIKADMQPIGAYQERKPFTNHVLHLEKGDCFYIFSDGYADQFGGEKGKKFKYGKFRELILRIKEMPMQKQKEIFQQEIENWMEGYEQVDDMCVIGIKI
jgi:serine phosphatase RsbU (regulator of sigma subunit)